MPVVPTHPTTTPDPDVLRWVVPDGLLPFTGEVAHAPALLQKLMDDGTLRSVRVDGGGVLTLLGAGHDWRTEGARVRSALVDALGAPTSWKGASTSHASGPDDALEAAARQIAGRGDHDARALRAPAAAPLPLDGRGSQGRRVALHRADPPRAGRLSRSPTIFPPGCARRARLDALCGVGRPPLICVGDTPKT